jgi:hypothetical protein
MTNFEPQLENWVYACVSRLTDNYEWSQVCYDGDPNASRQQLEETIISAIMANEKLANAFVNKCRDNGIVEDSYFEDMED